MKTAAPPFLSNIMNIPTILSKNTLAALGQSDTHAVRVILHDVHNPSACRLRCRTRQFVFERCGVLMAHKLDIPLSVWMGGVSAGRFRDNRAVCDDFRDVKQKYTVQVVSWNGTSAPVETGNVLVELRRLLSALNAPDDVERASKIIANGGNAEEIAAYVDGVIGHLDTAPPAEETAAETTAQVRARKMREAKAAKKKALL